MWQSRLGWNLAIAFYLGGFWMKSDEEHCEFNKADYSRRAATWVRTREPWAWFCPAASKLYWEMWKRIIRVNVKRGEAGNECVSAEADLCSGGPYSTPWNLDIKATLGIFFSSEGGIIVWLPTRLPVTDSLSDGLEDTAIGIQCKHC